MPVAPFRPCRIRSCAGYQVANGYCAAHQSSANEFTESTPAYPYATRNDNKHFRRLRAAFLMRNPLCAQCGAPGAILDHVLAHRGNRDLFWNQNNWQVLCKLCHDRKTADEIHGRVTGARTRIEPNPAGAGGA